MCVCSGRLFSSCHDDASRFTRLLAKPGRMILEFEDLVPLVQVRRSLWWCMNTVMVVVVVGGRGGWWWWWWCRWWCCHCSCCCHLRAFSCVCVYVIYKSFCLPSLSISLFSSAAFRHPSPLSLKICVCVCVCV